MRLGSIARSSVDSQVFINERVSLLRDYAHNEIGISVGRNSTVLPSVGEITIVQGDFIQQFRKTCARHRRVKRAHASMAYACDFNHKSRKWSNMINSRVGIYAGCTQTAPYRSRYLQFGQPDRSWEIYRDFESDWFASSPHYEHIALADLRCERSRRPPEQDRDRKPAHNPRSNACRMAPAGCRAVATTMRVSTGTLPIRQAQRATPCRVKALVLSGRPDLAGRTVVAGRMVARGTPAVYPGEREAA